MKKYPEWAKTVLQLRTISAVPETTAHVTYWSGEEVKLHGLIRKRTGADRLLPDDEMLLVTLMKLKLNMTAKHLVFCSVYQTLQSAEFDQPGSFF